MSFICSFILKVKLLYKNTTNIAHAVNSDAADANLENQGLLE